MTHRIEICMARATPFANTFLRLSLLGLLAKIKVYFGYFGLVAAHCTIVSPIELSTETGCGRTRGHHSAYPPGIPAS